MNDDWGMDTRIEDDERRRREDEAWERHAANSAELSRLIAEYDEWTRTRLNPFRHFKEIANAFVR